MASASGRSAGAGRRWRRPLVAVALVALVTLVALDRLAATAAERALAGRLQSAEHLSARPSVTIRGFPFLTQLLTGRYRRIDLHARPLDRGGMRISSLTVHLSGVSVRASDALAGRVRQVPIAHSTATADLTYPDLNQLVARDGGPLGAALTVSAAGPGRLLIAGPVGLSLHAGIAVSGGRLTLTPDPADLATLPPLLTAAVTTALSTPLPLPTLPFGARLRSGTVDSAGVHLLATADRAVLRTG